jgi:opacity protein-like surface antigen
MRKQVLLSSAAALAVSALAAPALAADPMPIVMAPTTVATYVEQAPRTWTGGYVGGHASILRGLASDGFACETEGDPISLAWVSYVVGDVPFGDDCEEVLGLAVGAGSISIDLGGDDGGTANGGFENEIFGPVGLNGYAIGAQIGYLRQLGAGPNGFVIGGEVAASLTSAEGIFLAEVNDGTIDVAGIFEMRAYATATLRAGFAFGRMLVYAEGGLAIGSFAYSNNLGFNGTAMAHGFVYGGGIEGRISDHVTLFFEYNRLRINEVQMVGTELFGAVSTFIDVDATVNVFKVGFNIQFGGDH